jgi:dTMP kinase
MKEKGRFIVFEGIDGTGKSTQLSLLADYLRGMGVPLLKTREPSDGTYGKKIREMYGNRNNYSLEEELSLFVKDRKEHVAEVITPALNTGKTVLCDRYYFSTAAYQGAAGGVIEQIFSANSFAPEPDIVLLLKMKPEESVRRIRELRSEQLNDFEQLDQLSKVAAIYESFTHDCITPIDAAASVTQVENSIRMAVEGLFP